MKKKFCFLISIFTFVLLFSFCVLAAGDGQITYLSEDMVVEVGDSVTLSCEAVSVADGNVLYVWYQSDSNGENGTPVTSPSPDGEYSFDVGTPGENYYYCLVYYMYEDSSILVKSNVVNVSVNLVVNVERPDIELNLEKKYNIEKGGTLSLVYKCVTTDVNSSIVYQWYEEDSDSGVFNKLSGAVTDTFNVPTDKVGSTKYFCIANTVYNGSYSPNRQSEIATVTVVGHDHSFGEYTVIASPSCTDDGKEARYCSVCGATEERILTTTGHSFGKWETIKEPTESRDGKERRSCSLCGESEDRAISKLEADDTTIKDDTTMKEETTVNKETTSNSVTDTDKVTSADTLEIVTDSENTDKSDSEEKNGFPWWVAIMLFGMVAAVAFAGLAGYNFGRTKTYSDIASKYVSIKNNNEKK